MKKRTTRCLALLLAVVMILSVMPVAMAEGTSQTATLVKDASTLKVGDKIVIAAKDADYALGTNQKPNNRAAVAVTKDGEKLTLNDSVQILTLASGTKAGTFAFNAGSGYLYADGNAKGQNGAQKNQNNLKTSKDLTVTDNASWKIEIAEGTTSVVAQGENGCNKLYYNSNSKLFSAYALKQQDIAIYKVDSAQAPVATPTASVVDGAEINAGAEIDLEVGKEITFTCDTPDAKIYYTFGSSTEKQTYSASDPIKASTSGTYTVWAERAGMKASETLTFSVKVYRLVDKYVKTNTIATDDQVVIYNAGNSNAVAGQMKGSWYLTPVSATAAEDVLTADSFETLVWTVTKNADGTYTFKQGDKTLAMGTNNGKFNLNLTGNGAATWDVETCNAENASYYMSGTGVTGEYGKVYIEYFGQFTEFSAYCTSVGRLTEKDFGMTFYKLTQDKDYIGGSDVPAEQVATPTASPAASEVAKGTEVSFSCATADAKIFYKTTGEYIEYTAPIAVNENTTFTVKATKGGMKDSKEATFAYTVKTDAPAGLIADGTYVIYNPANMKAMSSATAATYYRAGTTVTLDGEQLKGWSAADVWTVQYNNGTYTISTQSGQKLSMAASRTSLLLDDESGNCNWKITEVSSGAGRYYVDNANRTDYYRLQWDTRSNGLRWSAFNGTGANFELVFYPVTDIPGPTPSEGLPKEGDKFVIYNQSAKGVLAAQSDSKTIEMAPATVADGKATPENGAVVFTVERNGNYYRFKSEAYGYLCSNGTGSNAFYSKDFSEEGVTTNDADWLVRTCSGNAGGFEMESRTAKYKGYSQWLEYFAGSFKSYSMDKSKVTDYTIYSFFFYPVAADVNVDGGLVIKPTITFPAAMLPAYVGMDYEFDLNIDTLLAINTWTERSVKAADGTEIGQVTVTVPAGFTTGKTAAAVKVTAEQIKQAGGKMTLSFAFTDAEGNIARDSREIEIKDEPVISNLTPRQGAQTEDKKQPTISADIVNAGTGASVTMTVNGTQVNATYDGKKVTYAPSADFADGTVTVNVTVKRQDGKTAAKTWSFTIGKAEFQLYFGQLHSHTQYSDGSGTLNSALDYIGNLPENANIDFVAFTDHSNYFDSKTNPNDKAALYDTKLVKDSDANHSWATYKKTVADFNESHSNLIALAGFEMTWSGGPGHINTFNTPGIVSRNNTELNSKENDAGMKAYYALLSQEEGADSISQFNHPGKTFGTFKDFSYWDPVIDSRMYMVEVGNGEGQIGAGGYYPSYSEYIKALDKGWHLAPTNNQDNHKGKWGNANDARDVILTDDFTEQGIYNAIRDMRMYATEDKNLEITYIVNGQQLGSIITEKPEKLNVSVTVYDPDKTDSIVKVELVANSGIVAHTWSDPAELASGKVEAELDPKYSYYFVRVTEGDGDLAVTAPVWVGETLKLGISSVECGTETPVTNEALTITTTLFNSEKTVAAIKSISYTVNGKAIDGTTGGASTVPASGTAAVTFQYTPTAARVMTVTVTVVLELNDEEYTFTRDIELDVLNADDLIYIGLDGSHHNEYINGNYSSTMGNFQTLASMYNVRLVELMTKDALMDACTNPKYKAIVLTAPSRRSKATTGGIISCYAEDELAKIKAFNEAGGVVLVMGYSDFYEYTGEGGDCNVTLTADQHMAAQQNLILAALGSKLRLGDDQTADSAHNDGRAYGIYTGSYGTSELLEGLVYDAERPFDTKYSQVFSQYGGCSVYIVDESGTATTDIPSTVTPVVYGNATTASKDGDKDGLGGAGMPKYNGNLLLLATEKIGNNGMILVTGGTMMADWQLQVKPEEIDSGADLVYSNYTIMENLLKNLNPVKITPIKTVQAEAEEGVKFTVEGIVTSNASGYDKDTAFFDCIYVQDDTAGINAFPVAGNFKIGDKVRITGTTSSYQGERQLAVKTIVKLTDAKAPAPKDVTAAQIDNGSVLGSLVRIKGTITKVEKAEGKIQTIMVKDAAGNEARVFIDGYITTDKEVQDAIVGYQVEAVGLASYDNTFVLSDGTPVYPRIRIRDRSDITCTKGSDSSDPDTPVIPVIPSKPGNTGTAKKLPFTDVSRSDWFYDDVRYVYENGIMDGTGAYRFAPNAQLTRAMIVTILYRMDGSPAVSGASAFTDADSGMWYGKAVTWAAANGIVNGYGSGRFGPNDPVTREQLAAILYRYTAYRKASAASNGDNLASFSDLGTVSGYALESMNWAVGAGLLKGANGKLDPKANATRAQVAAIIHRYLER